MPKIASSFELTLSGRRQGQTLSTWLYSELRLAILEGRLGPETRLPASRDFARLHGLSRGTVVTAFERLHSEGYLSSQVGRGTWVNGNALSRNSAQRKSATPPLFIRNIASAYKRPKPFVDFVPLGGVPFRVRDPALVEFPVKLWRRIASRRARKFDPYAAAEDDGRGYRPLREAIAHYLGASRGVRCTANQVMIVSGVQQALDLLARFLLKPNHPVWMEYPGIFSGQALPSGMSEQKIIPVRVDPQGLSVSAGVKACPAPKGISIPTPANQFPMGMTMSLQRRMEVLKLASRTGAFIIEDDYDSEYRFRESRYPLCKVWIKTQT